MLNKNKISFNVLIENEIPMNSASLLKHIKRSKLCKIPK